MIDVKKMQETNEETAQVREELRVGGPYGSDTFRDPAEMVTISANRFERLIRTTEILNQELGEYERKISQAHDFISTVAMEWAEKGMPIPSYEDLSRMAVILEWKEPYEIRDTRVTNRMRIDAKIKEKEEAANNGKAAD